MDRKTLSILARAGLLNDHAGHTRTARINPRHILGGPAFALAFNDDPDGDGDGNGDGPPAEPPEGLVPQEKVNSIVQERLAREREKHTRELAALGYSSFDELKAAEAERRSKAAEAKRAAEETQRKQLEQQQKWQELREFDQKKAQEEIELARREAEEARREREALTKTVRASQISTAIQSAAVNLGAYKPEQISMLLAGQVSHTEDGRMVVLGADGKPRTNGRGEDLSVADFVKEFVETNDHFQRAAGGRGAGGSGASPGTKPSGFDPKGMSVRELQQNQDEIIKMAKRGEIKLS